MQTEFNKLSIDERRKFIISNILQDKFFNKIHSTVKDTYCQYILEGDELVKFKLDLNNKKQASHISNALKEYEHSVDKIMAEYSRYKDLVYNVYSNKESIEELCKSKYINGTNGHSYYKNNYIFYDIIYCYYNTLSTIGKYGGETYGDEDQSLLKAVKILLNNPHICDEIKNSNKYKEYYDEIFNDPDEENNDEKDDEEINYDKEENDIDTADELELSDIENENESNNSDNTEDN
jgi:hypothetical protein